MGIPDGAHARQQRQRPRHRPRHRGTRARGCRAAAELLHVVLIVVFIAACTGAVGVVALLALKCRRVRAGAAARTMPPLPPQVVRAAPPLPQERRVGDLPRESQRELPGELHLHFHGISADEVAAIVRQQEGTR
jgi:hypothetical protein